VSYTSSGAISQCSNTGAVIATGTSTSSNYIGGIAGYSNSSNGISQCSNTGSVTGSYCYSVAGIVGQNNSTGAISQCSNTGNVVGSYNAGGIVGRNNSTGTISQCFNKGSVTTTSTSTSSSYSVGGIAGYVSGAATIDQCYNAGSVSGGVMSVGGIIGYMSNASAQLTNCYNTGSITSTSTSSTAQTGGIVGRTNNASCTVRNTYNAGIITVSNTGSYTGGIVGYAAGNTNISNNYYLDTTASRGLGYATDNAVSKTSSELAALAPTLGQYFKAGSIYPILVWQPNEVTVNAPASAVYGSDFTVSLDVSELNNFNVADYTITYDPAVLRLDSITGGTIGSTTVPVYYNESTPEQSRLSMT
jgi:hypothetical protein